VACHCTVSVASPEAGAVVSQVAEGVSWPVVNGPGKLSGPQPVPVGAMISQEMSDRVSVPPFTPCRNQVTVPAGGDRVRSPKLRCVELDESLGRGCTPAQQRRGTDRKQGQHRANYDPTRWAHGLPSHVSNASYHILQELGVSVSACRLSSP
jgi:hypothetical protein